jgi:hypothetical protein
MKRNNVAENKAESLTINSVGQRPTKQDAHEPQALKGRNQIHN